MDRLNSLSNRAIISLLIMVALVTGGVSLALDASRDHDLTDWAVAWLRQFSGEILAVTVIFIVLEVVINVRRQRTQLVQRLRSASERDAQGACQELEEQGWFRNGALRGANLSFAQLQNALLTDANLQEVELVGADLRRAELVAADLQGANLIAADLRQANMVGADLERARLNHARLQGADLIAANLRGTVLEGAQFDHDTLLPDGTKWTEGTDMRRFTDVQHPVFWRSDYPFSPAYRGTA